MPDVLASLKPPELAAFYGRLADTVDRKRGSLKVSLAALLMRQWLKNRDPKSTFEFEAPEHLTVHSQVLDVLGFHRRVYLTQEKIHLTGGVTKWAGVIPRLTGQPPFPKWNAKSPLALDYESLVEIPLRYQLTGDDADRDLLYGLHGFQLKSNVALTAMPILNSSKLRIHFQFFQAKIRDRYNWDYSEHFTVPNPDFGSKVPSAVTPKSQTVTVYHINAKRLEDAQLAAPFDLASKPWQVAEARLRTPADVEPKHP